MKTLYMELSAPHTHPQSETPFQLVCHKHLQVALIFLYLPSDSAGGLSHCLGSWISVAPSDSALLCCVVELQRRLSSGIHATCCPG